MVDITDILNPSCTRSDVAAQSRKRALEQAADLLAGQYPELSARVLFDELMGRERLGSTALGEGIAIPHCRMDCDRIVGAFLQLVQPVEYEAADQLPVDLLFVLVVPTQETSAHLEVLALLARMFQSAENRERLRDCDSGPMLYQELVAQAARASA